MILNKDEFNAFRKKYVKKLKESIFIYPTDTIYGLGCDATNEELVSKLRDLKGNSTQPLSIIAPSKEWVYENCEVSDKQKEFVEKLGEYIQIDGKEHKFTLLLKLKNKDAISKNVSPGKDTIGVRIPHNWFSEVVKEMKVPIITTSANKTGADFMTSLEDLNSELKHNVNLIIYDGELEGRPSTIINLVEYEKLLEK